MSTPRRRLQPARAPTPRFLGAARGQGHAPAVRDVGGGQRAALVLAFAASVGEAQHLVQPQQPARAVLPAAAGMMSARAAAPRPASAAARGAPVASIVAMPEAVLRLRVAEHQQHRLQRLDFRVLRHHLVRHGAGRRRCVNFASCAVQFGTRRSLRFSGRMGRGAGRSRSRSRSRERKRSRSRERRRSRSGSRERKRRSRSRSRSRDKARRVRSARGSDRSACRAGGTACCIDIPDGQPSRAAC